GGRVHGAHDLATELDRTLLVERDLLHPAADALTSLQDDDVGASRREITCGDETGEARAEDDDVRHSSPASRGAGSGDSMRTRNASGGRYADTRSPSRYGSSSPAFVTSACRPASEGSLRWTCGVAPR